MQIENFESALNSYYGGRVQNFAISGEFYKNVNVYDINSLYPSVMVNNDYPNPKKMWKCEKPSLELLNAYLLESKCVWGKFILQTKDGLLFLPNKNDEGRRDYTLKDFEGYLCGPELIFALENGWELIDIVELYAACPIRPFDGYVNYWMAVEIFDWYYVQDGKTPYVPEGVGLQMMDAEGNIFVTARMRNMLLSSLSALDLNFSSNTIEFQTFDMTFTYNALEIVVNTD